MKKSEAVAIFGTTQTELARALNLTKSAISQWPEQLDQPQTDRVIGAAVRLGYSLTHLKKMQRTDNAA